MPIRRSATAASSPQRSVAVAHHEIELLALNLYQLGQAAAVRVVELPDVVRMDAATLKDGDNPVHAPASLMQTCR